MKSIDLALFGSNPEFDTPLPVGQLYYPSWERYKSVFREIFARQYYTNQGPLVRDLEMKLEAFLGVKNAICVSNATIGLMMTADAIGGKKVIVPAFTFIASAQSLTWAGLTPVFCDINHETHQIGINQVHMLIDKDVSAIMGVNLWGGACDPRALEDLAKMYEIQLYFDSAHSFGCAVNGVKIGNFGCAEVFSFHATKILSATEGGCVCTNDDNLAERLRNIRSSYGTGKLVEIVKTANGRMSEAQAAIALMSLEDFSKNQKNNAKLYKIYEDKLALVPGLKLIKPSGVSFSNYQYVVCMVDKKKFGLSRDMLMKLLEAENVFARRYFYPGLHRIVPFVDDFPADRDSLPNTDRVCESCIQFPIGAPVSGDDIERICNIVMKAHKLSPEIKSQYE